MTLVDTFSFEAAQQSDAARAGDGARSYVTFRLALQSFALPIEPIAQIVEMVLITPLPQTSAFVKGIINWHGNLVPVLDLASQLGVRDHTSHWNAHIVLVQYEGRYVGLVVDEVLDVIRLTPQQISHPSDILPVGLSETVHLIDGLARQGDRLLLLLDLDQLFVRNNFSLDDLTAHLSPLLTGEEAGRAAAEPAMSAVPMLM